MSAAASVDELRSTLEAREEPGVAELLEAMRPILPDAGAAEWAFAELHGRGAGHALLPEVRQYGKDLGLAFFAANVGDAIRGLELLGGEHAPRELRSLGDRLLRRIYPLSVDMPRRAQVLRDVGGP